MTIVFSLSNASALNKSNINIATAGSWINISYKQLQENESCKRLEAIRTKTYSKSNPEQTKILPLRYLTIFYHFVNITGNTYLG